jgi:hypothetical protein
VKKIYGKKYVEKNMWKQICEKKQIEKYVRNDTK